jgi:RNA polymerase sigma-B factor
VASLALVKAIDRFDPDRGLAFSSFAVPTILGELKRHFRDKGWAIHIPRGLMEIMLNVQNAEATLSSRGGRSPTVVEIAEYLAVGPEQVDTSVTLAAVVKQLRAEDRRVLALRINDELTQKEIAARIGVSQMQVSRILRRITDELHERIEL